MADDSTRSNRVWTLPNLISMIRLAGVPVFLWLVLGPEADGWALALLMVSGITDFLDGWLARRLNQTSVVGQILDPVADRLYILAVVVGLAPGLHKMLIELADPSHKILGSETVSVIVPEPKAAESHAH